MDLEWTSNRTGQVQNWMTFTVNDWASNLTFFRISPVYHLWQRSQRGLVRSPRALGKPPVSGRRMKTTYFSHIYYDFYYDFEQSEGQRMV